MVFSESLSKFVRSYEYIAQLVEFGDPVLEAFASFACLLRKRLKNSKQHARSKPDIQHLMGRLHGQACTDSRKATRMPGTLACLTTVMRKVSLPSRSAAGRFMTLTGMAARIAGGVVGQRLLNGRSAIDWQPVGVLLGEVLGNMKGPVLKLGQMTSQWQGILPEPILQALGRLQNQVPALPYEYLEAHLQRCYDSDLGRVFRHIDRSPLPPRPWPRCTVPSLSMVSR